MSALSIGGRDYFSQYLKGYRWDPINGEFGHKQDEEASDNDVKTCSDAEK